MKYVMLIVIMGLSSASFASQWHLVKMDFTLGSDFGSDVNGNEYMGGICGIDGAAPTESGCEGMKAKAIEVITGLYTGAEAYLVTGVKYGCMQSGDSAQSNVDEDLFRYCATLSGGKSYATYAGRANPDGVVDVRYKKVAED